MRRSTGPGCCGESPVKVTKRSQLRDELANRTTGGIYFTTLQKFGLTDDERKSGADHPLLTDRRNIIVIVDEAHRSHYDDLDGYARHIRDALPNAVVHRVHRHADLVRRPQHPRRVRRLHRHLRPHPGGRGQATVPVYFEPRLIKVGLAKDVSEDDLDQAADEATAGLDDVERAQIEKSVAVINAVYGAPERLEALADDILDALGSPLGGDAPSSSPRRARRSSSAPPGRSAPTLYEEIIELRPDWHDDAVDKGAIKVVYSGSPPGPAAWSPSTCAATPRTRRSRSG